MWYCLAVTTLDPCTNHPVLLVEIIMSTRTLGRIDTVEFGAEYFDLRKYIHILRLAFSPLSFSLLVSQMLFILRLWKYLQIIFSTSVVSKMESFSLYSSLVIVFFAWALSAHLKSYLRSRKFKSYAPLVGNSWWDTLMWREMTGKDLLIDAYQKVLLCFFHT